ncbi:hypothetical protein OIO89_00535 (plasmid) [Mycobacterium ulcerans]|nr:hypothetical protein OIO89_00535 [Mycobacterium ulcerans]
MPSHACDVHPADHGPGQKNRAADGLTTVTVLGVTITGDTAKADLDSTNELIGSMQVSMTLARTEDGWKICMLR